MTDVQDRKREAAIAAAVSAYIKSEEEMAAVSDLVAASRGCSALERGPFERANAWGLDGRTQMMQTRQLMQLKAFYR